MTTTGQNRKKALVLLSDGNDTTSKTSLREVKQVIRESEALVYAIGIDCGTDGSRGLPRPQFQRRRPMPMPLPFPPGRRGWPMPPPPPRPPLIPPQERTWTQGCSDPVDVGALRDMTDDSGGRTEIVRDPRISTPRPPASPTSSASSTISGISRPEKRTAFGTPFEWNSAIKATEFALVGATSLRSLRLPLER